MRQAITIKRGHKRQCTERTPHTSKNKTRPWKKHKYERQQKKPHGYGENTPFTQRLLEDYFNRSFEERKGIATEEMLTHKYFQEETMKKEMRKVFQE